MNSTEPLTDLPKTGLAWFTLAISTCLLLLVCVWALLNQDFLLNGGPLTIPSVIASNFSENDNDNASNNAIEDTQQTSVGGDDANGSGASVEASENPVTENTEQERIAAEKAEAEKLAEEKAEQEKVEQEKLAADEAEAEKRAAEQAEQERLAAEAEAEKLAAEQAEQERLTAEAEAERLAAEQAEQERLAAEAEAERLAAEQAEQERLAAEAEAERLAAEQAEQERLAAEAEAERLAAEQAEQERLAAEAEAERLAAEQAEQERLAAEAEAERLAAEQAELERLAAEAEAERLAAEREAQETREAQQLLATPQRTIAIADAPVGDALVASEDESPLERLRREELAELPELSNQLVFETTQIDLLPETKKLLDRVFELLFLYSKTTATVEVASNEYAVDNNNRLISRERALTIVNYMIDRGLDEERFRIRALGKQQLAENTHRVSVGVTVLEN